MSQALTFARPYARAVFALAREQHRLPEFSRQLAFAALAVSQPQVQAVLGDPRVTAAQLVDVLLPPDADDTFRQFLTVLGDNRRLPLLPEIAGLFDQLRAEAERIVQAKVTSAHALDAAELAKLQAALKKRFGREVEVETAVDPTLIGGAIIDAGDVVIDGSIKTKLARLGTALAH